MVICKPRNSTPHPRDGPWAWLVCIVCTVILGLTFGYILSFGVFLPVLSKHFNESRGNTAWIGSLAIGCSYFFGPIAVMTINITGERTVSVCSGLIASSLLAVSSFVNSMTILYFSHGVLLGICGCFILNSVIIMVRRYFKEKLAIAVGIASSGSSLGMLVIGPVLQIMIEAVGWRGAFRVMCGVMVFMTLLCIVMDPNVEEEEQSKVRTDIRDHTQSQTKGVVDCSIWKSPRYVLGNIVVFLTHFGLIVPSIHLVRFAEEHDISNYQSSLLFIYIGVCSSVIRIIIGKIIQRRWLTPMQGVQLSAVTIGVSMILFTQAHLYYHFVLFAVFYGLGSGAFTTTLTMFFLTCFDDINKAAIGLGTGLCISSVALFTGAPIAGFIADKFQSYIPAFYIFGGLVTLAAALPFGLSCAPKENSEVDVLDVARLRLVGYRLATSNSRNRYSAYIDTGIYV